MRPHPDPMASDVTGQHRYGRTPMAGSCGAGGRVPGARGSMAGQCLRSPHSGEAAQSRAVSNRRRGHQHGCDPETGGDPPASDALPGRDAGVADPATRVR